MHLWDLFASTCIYSILGRNFGAFIVPQNLQMSFWNEKLEVSSDGRQSRKGGEKTSGESISEDQYQPIPHKVKSD